MSVHKDDYDTLKRKADALAEALENIRPRLSEIEHFHPKVILKEDHEIIIKALKQYRGEE